MKLLRRFRSIMHKRRTRRRQSVSSKVTPTGFEPGEKPHSEAASGVGTLIGTRDAGPKPRCYYWSSRRRHRVIDAASKVIRGAQLFGWSISSKEVAKSGSTYVKLARPDGAKVFIRVADHQNKQWRTPKRGRYDCRTQPHDLLCVLRWLRSVPAPIPEKDLMSADEEIQTATEMMQEIHRREYDAMK